VREGLAMLTYREPLPVKVFAGVLLAPTADWDGLCRHLRDTWGPEDLVTDPEPFDWTSYYAAEMGDRLQRRFIGFARLVSPSCLPRLKQEATVAEAELADASLRRCVNIDVGYLDLHKVVLASTKQGPLRVALAHGIWADVVLHYRKGRFEAFDRTFADFRSDRYGAFFLRLRELYKRDLGERLRGT
jgi:hypothetical protein